MARTAFHIGTIRGTPILVQTSFLVLAGLFVVLDLERREPMSWALLWVPVLFISVLVHELAHASAFGVFGFGPSTIVLGGFGGATFNRRRSRPWQEIISSVAGPGSSFLLAILFSQLTAVLPAGTLGWKFCDHMRDANFVWGIFNLIPLDPLDGAHALRQLLIMILPARIATTAAEVISYGCGALLLVYAVLSRRYLLLIVVAMLLVQNFQQRKLRRSPDPAPESGAE